MIEQVIPATAIPRPFFGPLGWQCFSDVAPKIKPTIPVTIPRYQITSDTIPKTIDATAGPWVGA